MIRDLFGRFALQVNRFSSSPTATGLAFLAILVWALFGPATRYSEGWQLVINTGTTIVTFLMVFILQNAQSRDTTAINAKLDALIVALDRADNRLVGLEKRPETVAEALKEEIEEQFEDETSAIEVQVKARRK